jgi:hypothetical protein
VAEVPKRLGPSRPPYFASGGDEECAFCFDVTQDRGDGEYPVYFCHQDHPRARIHDTSEWDDPDDATPEFANFAEWLTWIAKPLASGQEPANSTPTTFEEMPGRQR